MKTNLTLLADFLQTSVPPKKFYLGTFRSPVDDLPFYDALDAPRRSADDRALLDPGCGTTGCAIGWACAMPEFKAQGLTYDAKRGAVMVDGDDGNRPFGPDLIGWLAELFEVTNQEIVWLFYPQTYARNDETEISEVIVRMRHLIAGGTIVDYQQ